jgi:tRNA threonylcarbamoyladenosine biosynthesis protein TsaB
MTIKLLTIDTATSSAYSVALTIGDATQERFVVAEQKSSDMILPLLQTLLAEAGVTLKQLDAIAFGCGPGSFTGARLAASIVQGLCFGCDLPTIPISTLQALAQGTWREHGAERILLALDARMQEIYWAAYELNTNKLMQPVVKDLLCQPDKIILPNEKEKIWSAAGNAWSVYEQNLKTISEKNKLLLNKIYTEQESHAKDIATLALDKYKKGALLNAAQVLPVYLQEDVYKKGTSNVLKEYTK